MAEIKGGIEEVLEDVRAMVADWNPMHAKMLEVADGLAERAENAGIPFSTDYVGGMFGLYFRERIPTTFAEVSECDIELFKKFFHAMLIKGVYFAPSAFEAGFVSATHDDTVIQRTLDIAEEVFSKL